MSIAIADQSIENAKVWFARLWQVEDDRQRAIAAMLLAESDDIGGEPSISTINVSIDEAASFAADSMFDDVITAITAIGG